MKTAQTTKQGTSQMKRTKSVKAFAFILLCLSIALIGACGNKEQNKQMEPEQVEQKQNNGNREPQASSNENSETQSLNNEDSKTDSNNTEPVSEASSFPKTLDVQGEQVTIEKKPERVAALSLDAAEAVLELSGASQLAAIPKSSTNSALAFQAEEAAKVEHQIASATSLDPEEVMSFNSDLLLMTKVHTAEQDADQLLMQAGIPIISLTAWNTMENLWNNYELIGNAIGAEEKAAQVIEDMKAKADHVQMKVDGAKKPSVMVISPLGPGTGPYFIGSSNISYDIVKRAGAEHSADTLGLTRVTKASIEQIIQADPDNIILIQWQEGDTKDLEEVTNTPGWETLQAVKNDRIKLMTVKELFYPNRYNADSLEEIAKWLHPDRY